MNNSIPSGLSTTGSRAMIAGLVLGAFVLSSVRAAPLQLPAWPQRFEITGPESVSFGFIVTQPGPVIVEIQTNGTPIVATLQSAQPPAAEQSGSGSLRLAYQVTARDIQTNPMWTIKMKLAPPMSTESAGHAAGNVVVHAAVDPGVAQALLEKGVAQQQSAKQAAAQRRPQADPAVTAQMDAVLNGRRAQFEQQRQQVRAQMHAQLQPLAAAAQARLANRVGTRGLAPASTATMTAAPPTELRAARVSTVSATASSSQALTAAGSGPGPKTVMPNAVINSLSAVQGQPGDPVLINGSGFANGGEVHFVINPGKDVVAHVDIWSDTQIFAEVPDASGILGFNGQVYVVRTPDLARSNIVPFQFNPGTEFRDLRSTLDRVLQYPYIASSTTGSEVDRDNANPFSGFQGNDMLFLTTRLKNGWVVDDAFVYCMYNLYGMNFCSGGAYPAAVSRGSPSPSLTVHWWIDPGPFGNYSNLAYQFDVRIVGPKGVPDGVAVP